MSKKYKIDLTELGFDDGMESRTPNRTDQEYLEAYEEALETKVGWAKEELEAFRLKYNPRPPRKPKKVPEAEALSKHRRAIPDVEYDGPQNPYDDYG